MENHPFLSVIIPVYKVEKYLPQCVDSILAQHLTDYEIILVDDGSPDGCPQICDRYAREYDCIRVIHKANGGSSSARNAGIRAAAGEYLIFMDSDDWWNPDVSVTDMLASVRSKPEVEMFLFTSLDYVEGEGLFKRNEHECLTQISIASVAEYYSDLIKNGNLEVSAATKVLKASFIRDNALSFKEGIVSEDCEWMLRLLRKLSTVDIINLPLYICRLGRSGSITNSITPKSVIDMLGIVKNSLALSQPEADPVIRNNELCYCSYLWFCALGLSSRLDKDERRKLKPLFKETESVCQYSNSKKTKLSNFCLNTLGFDMTLLILGKYIAIKGKHKLNKHKVESQT